MAFGSGSSFGRDCSTRRRGSPSSLKLCKNSAALLCSTSTRPQSPQPTRPYPPPTSSVDLAFFFSRIQRIGRSDPALGSLPANPHTFQGGSDGLPGYPLFSEPFLEADLRSHLHRPQAALLAELSGAPMKHLTQSFHPLLIEGAMKIGRAHV